MGKDRDDDEEFFDAVELEQEEPVVTGSEAAAVRTRFQAIGDGLYAIRDSLYKYSGVESVVNNAKSTKQGVEKILIEGGRLGQNAESLNNEVEKLIENLRLVNEQVAPAVLGVVEPINAASKVLEKTAPVLDDAIETVKDVLPVVKDVNTTIKPIAGFWAEQQRVRMREQRRMKKRWKKLENAFNSFAKSTREFFHRLPSKIRGGLSTIINSVLHNLTSVENWFVRKRAQASPNPQELQELLGASDLRSPISQDSSSPRSLASQSTSINSGVESSNSPMPQESIRQDWRSDTKVTITKYERSTESLNQPGPDQEAFENYWRQRVGAPPRQPNGQVMTADEQIKRKADRRRKTHEEAVRIFRELHEQTDRSARPMMGNLPDHLGDGSAAGGSGESTTGIKRKKGAVEFTPKIVDTKEWKNPQKKLWAKSIRRSPKSSDRTPRN